MPHLNKRSPLLFSPLELRGISVRNRIMASPMCQYVSRNGSPVDWHFGHLGRLAIGGAGIVFYEETAVEARGRKTYGCAGIWQDEQISEYRRISDLIRMAGAVPAMQLGHSGAKASSHDATQDWRPLTEDDCKLEMPPWTPISASAVAAAPSRPVARPLTVAEIDRLIVAWMEAARRTLEAGFDILEIHGAHGYLIHQFLSPLTNHRRDGYGGSRNARMRFALEVVEAVRSVWPEDKPLFFRASCVDGRGGVWNIEDTVALARALKLRGVDMLDCSSGGLSGNSDMPILPRVPGYHVAFAERVRQDTGLKTVAVGLIDEAQQAEDILALGRADIIGMARTLLENGDWPLDAARQLGVKDPYGLLPSQYAHRLRRRDEVSKLEVNKVQNVPRSVSDLIETT